MTFHSYKEKKDKTSAYVRPTTLEDVMELCETMRKEDKEEVIASHGSVYEALMDSFSSSDFVETVFTPDDLVAGIYGVAPLEYEENPFYCKVATPWFLSSIYLPEVWYTFLKGSREWVRNVNKVYPVLTNCVDAEYEKSIQWLRFLGFTFIGRIEEYGVKPKPFLEFVRISEK